MFASSFVDCIFPIAEPPSKDTETQEAEKRKRRQDEWEAQVAALPADKDVLHDSFLECKAALEEERHRQQSVESRLTTIVGLFSIASTVVFGTILTAMPSVAAVPRASRWLLAAIFVSLAYLILQLVSAMLAGVRGLERRGARVFPDLLPDPYERLINYYRRQIREFNEILQETRDRNNAKVTQMAVAHRAMKNFIFGMTIFAIFGGAYRITSPPPGKDLVDQIKSDHSLLDQLRGPRGERGPAGPPGPTAPHVPERTTRGTGHSNKTK